MKETEAEAAFREWQAAREALTLAENDLREIDRERMRVSSRRETAIKAEAEAWAKVEAIRPKVRP
jgi:hypothetical protein